MNLIKSKLLVKIDQNSDGQRYCSPMAKSEYPSILDTEEFSREIGKTEELSLYLNPCRRYFIVILDFNFENLCFQHTFIVKLTELIKNLGCSLNFKKKITKKKRGNFEKILTVKLRNFGN